MRVLEQPMKTTYWVYDALSGVYDLRPSRELICQETTPYEAAKSWGYKFLQEDGDEARVRVVSSRGGEVTEHNVDACISREIEAYTTRRADCVSFSVYLGSQYIGNYKYEDARGGMKAFLTQHFRSQFGHGMYLITPIDPLSGRQAKVADSITVDADPDLDFQI